MKISRRQALGTALGAGLAGGLSGCAATVPTDVGKSVQPSAKFSHGVASGDPAQDGFVIWTRISPDENKGTLAVFWEVSTTSDFSELVKVGSAEAEAGRDWTIKEELTGLEPGQTYYYRFRGVDGSSPIGRAKTLPEGNVRSARFAIISCSNYPFGYFNVYDEIARQDSFDAVIHLGDYIYEYGRDGYGGKVGKALGRNHEPANEILSLADYRKRHGQYKADPASRAMHAAHSMIAIWDDHEVANNTWEAGAQNHQDGEGGWNARRNAALQAYYEWMPVREPSPGNTRADLYRTYQWGDLLTLAAIETRLTARSQQLEYANYMASIKTPEDIANFRKNILWSDDRYLIGDTQMAYLRNAIGGGEQRKTGWRMIANQVIMAEVAAPDLSAFVNEPFVDEIEKELPYIREFLKFSALGLPLNLDAWDGYPAARERFYQMAQSENVRDLLVVTGDSHEYWANDLTAQNGQKMGVELGTSGVTSPGASSYFGEAAQEFSRLVREKNDAVRYHDTARHGYIDLTLDEEKGRVKYISVDTVLKPNYTAYVSASFDIVRTGGTLDFANPEGPGFQGRGF